MVKLEGIMKKNNQYSALNMLVKEIMTKNPISSIDKNCL